MVCLQREKYRPRTRLIKIRVLAPKKYRRKGGQENVWLTRGVVVYTGKQCDHERTIKIFHVPTAVTRERAVQGVMSMI